jgi:hypothetical protein
VGNRQKCLIKVTGYDNAGRIVGADKSDKTFTIEVVTVNSPHQGDLLTAGNTYPIVWTSYETKYPIAAVKLHYTKDGGANWHLISTLTDSAFLTAGTHSFEFVPIARSTVRQCKVRVTLKDVSGNILGKDKSDGYFRIKPP